MPKKPTEYDVNLDLIGNEAAVKRLDEKIEKLRVMFGKPPPAVMALGNPALKAWKDKALIYYGKVLGTMETMGDFDILPREYILKVEEDLKNMLQGNLTQVVVGKLRSH